MGLAYGGPVTALVGLSSTQLRSGHDVTVVTTGVGTGIESLDGVPVYRFHAGPGAWKWSRSLGKGLAELLESADIVHIHMVWEYTSLVTARTCQRLAIPYILRPCGLLDRWALDQKPLKKKAYLWLFKRYLIDGASGIHYTTRLEYERSVFRRLKRESFIIPIGLSDAPPTLLGSECDLVARFPELSGRRIVLFLGRIHPKKNPEIVISAFARVAGMHPYACLLMSGPGEREYLEHLSHFAESLGLRGRVTFSGMLERAAVQEAYELSDVFLLPSNLENFGISVAEAMRAGCPVIVSDQVYLAPDILEAGAGLVCRLDIDEFASAIAKILGNPHAKQELGERGRTLAAENYNWKVISPRLDAIYRDIVEDRRISHEWV